MTKGGVEKFMKLMLMVICDSNYHMKLIFVKILFLFYVVMVIKRSKDVDKLMEAAFVQKVISHFIHQYNDKPLRRTLYIADTIFQYSYNHRFTCCFTASIEKPSED